MSHKTQPNSLECGKGMWKGWGEDKECWWKSKQNFICMYKIVKEKIQKENLKPGTRTHICKPKNWVTGELRVHGNLCHCLNL